MIADECYRVNSAGEDNKLSMQRGGGELAVDKSILTAVLDHGGQFSYCGGVFVLVHAWTDF